MQRRITRISFLVIMHRPMEFILILLPFVGQLGRHDVAKERIQFIWKLSTVETLACECARPVQQPRTPIAKRGTSGWVAAGAIFRDRDHTCVPPAR
jgi:hypothetical protein